MTSEKNFSDETEPHFVGFGNLIIANRFTSEISKKSPRSSKFKSFGFELTRGIKDSHSCHCGGLLARQLCSIIPPYEKKMKEIITNDGNTYWLDKKNRKYDLNGNKIKNESKQRIRK